MSELNELQEAVLDVLNDALDTSVTVERNDLLERVQLTPGLDGVSHQRMGPCTANLRRRGLIDEPKHGVFRITTVGADALHYAQDDDYYEVVPEELAPAVAVSTPGPVSPPLPPTANPEPEAAADHIVDANKKAEQPCRWRALDALLAEPDLGRYHDPQLQTDLRELLMGLGMRSMSAACALSDDDPRRVDLHDLSQTCRDLSDTLKTALIAPGHAPEVSS